MMENDNFKSAIEKSIGLEAGQLPDEIAEDLYAKLIAKSKEVLKRDRSASLDDLLKDVDLLEFIKESFTVDNGPIDDILDELKKKKPKQDS